MDPIVPSIDELLDDHALFESFIYTPVETALEELKNRWSDPSVPDIPNVPPALRDGFTAVIFRQIVTSNYEIRRFVSIADLLDLKPLFWEYYDDKFTSNNEWKHSLGRMFFYKGTGKKGGARISSMNVIDFNASNGKALKDVSTIWGESLVDFHHMMFENRYRTMPEAFFDASQWFSENGKSAQNYYVPFLSLFLKYGILLENFYSNENERTFTRDIFLPAFIEIYRTTGKKPLVVSLEPTDVEGDRFWICHPDEDRCFPLERHDGSL